MPFPLLITTYFWLNISYFIDKPFVIIPQLFFLFAFQVLNCMIQAFSIFLAFFSFFSHFTHYAFAKSNRLQGFDQPLVLNHSKFMQLFFLAAGVQERSFGSNFILNLHGFPRIVQNLIMMFLILKLKEGTAFAVANKVAIHQIYFKAALQNDGDVIAQLLQQYLYPSPLPAMSQITASRMNMQLYKQKIAAARKGHELLKRKADALKKKFKQVMKSLLESKQNMGKQLKQAYFLMAEAKYAAGEFQGKVVEAVKKATIRLDRSEENIAGVLIPNLNVKENREADDNDNGMSQIGLQRGGLAIQNCREKFRAIITNLVEIASMQASFLTLDEKIKVTNRRVNALQHVVIPKFNDIYRYIEQELDEQARQDFFRLKKVLDNKKKHNEEEEKIKSKEAGNQHHEQHESQNLLDDVDDDIIF